MRRVWVVALVTGCLVTSTACSYVEQFFVINASSRPLTVVAAASSYENLNTGERVCSFSAQGKRVGVLPAERVRRDYIPINEISEQTDATFDDEGCSVHVTVNARTALLLWSTSNGMRTPFLTKVALLDQQGKQKVFEGTKVAERFRKRSVNVYVIEWR